MKVKVTRSNSWGGHTSSWLWRSLEHRTFLVLMVVLSKLKIAPTHCGLDALGIHQKLISVFQLGLQITLMLLTFLDDEVA